MVRDQVLAMQSGSHRSDDVGPAAGGLDLILVEWMWMMGKRWGTLVG